MRIFALLLFYAVIFTSTAQERLDSVELITKAYLLDEVNKDLFYNENHSRNCIFVIKNKILEEDSLKRFFPSQYHFESFIVVLYPRKYLIGHNINYWIQIDEIRINGNNAFLIFRTVYSNDNWFAENDVTKIKGEINFVRVKNGSWEITRKKIKSQNK